MEGPLEKKGKFKTWSWSKYWFVLDEDQLCYYKDSQVRLHLTFMPFTNCLLAEINRIANVSEFLYSYH